MLASREADVSVHAGTPKNGTNTESARPKSMSAASITGQPARSVRTTCLPLPLRRIISAPKRPRCVRAISSSIGLDILVYSDATGWRIE
ncbi:hypothetical protein D9M72_442340 [compost metagenome]